MINNEIIQQFHKKAFIIYNNEDWYKFLLKINPYLFRHFHKDLFERFIEYNNRPLYLRMYVDSFNNSLSIDGWDLLTNFNRHNDPLQIKMIHCREGLPKWILNL